jgi:hypothetical protein
MKAHPQQVTTCPLAAVDKRLGDAHRLWHQAERAYFDPDGFRLAVQNTIQTLRTVTFILQKSKAVIAGFDSWYGPWQERMRTDPLQCWMRDARNKIEKEGDLKAHSFVRAEIIASYLDEGPGIEVRTKLFQSLKALLRRIPNDPLLDEHIRHHGVLRMERRWVENTLPNFELLDALAVAYGKVAELVHDAHHQIGLPPPQMIHAGEAGESYDLAAMGWRFPCMIGHELSRTVFISLTDGRKIELEQNSLAVDIAVAAENTARYDINPTTVMRHEYSNYDDLAAGYFNMFRSVFLKDGHHDTILFLFTTMQTVRVIKAIFEDSKSKYVMMRELANEVMKSGADAAMLVGESWTAPANSLKPYERPSESSVRTEGLSATVVRKDGEPLELRAKIRRDGGVVSLEETQIVPGQAPFIFAPFYRAWGREIPSSWIGVGAAIIAAAKKE